MMPNKRFSLFFFSIESKLTTLSKIFVPSKAHHSSSRRTLAHHPVITHRQSPPTTQHIVAPLTSSPLTSSHSHPHSTHTHKRKKIRKVENRKKKRRKDERERKERTTPARAPPRRPSSLCALTVALASPSHVLTVAAQYHHRVCSLSLLSIIVVAQHRHRRSLEKEGKVSGKDTKTNETKKMVLVQRMIQGAMPKQLKKARERNYLHNIEIMLTKVKMPLPDMMAAVLAMDESVLDVDQVENLIKFCPTKEEMELLKGYTGDKENLGKCEQYFLELMKVPRVESKLRVFSFKIQFLSQVTEFKKSLKAVNSACEEVHCALTLGFLPVKNVIKTVAL
ncbi:Formin-like protein [Arachis hypogaea]|nr:Formin-like protein [Arachis hypogaea]